MTRNKFIGGFGLIEIMVGLAIGMIATVIMLEALSISESQKRTTTGAADAQSNGAISLFSMERDIRMAGWGLQGSAFLDCTEFYTYNTGTGGAIDANSTPGSSLLSVLEITEGGTNPDSITIRHYDDPSNQDFRFGISQIASAQATAAAPFVLRSATGCSNVGDLIIVADKLKCTLAQVSAVNAATGAVSHDEGPAFPFNAPNAVLAAWPAHDGSSKAQCIPSLFTRTYSLDPTTYKLQLTEGGAAVDIAPNIMDVQAQYGIDSAAGGTTWVAATGAWANPSIAQIRQIKAARIAVLARSDTFEKPEGSATCSTTDAAMIAGMSTWATFNTGSFPADYPCYRYKAYEINVPVRNVIWSRSS